MRVVLPLGAADLTSIDWFNRSTNTHTRTHASFPLFLPFLAYYTHIHPKHRSIDPAAFGGAIQRPTPKTINTHLHLLEATAAFHQALRFAAAGRDGGGGGGGGDKGEGEEGASLLGAVEGLLQELLALVTTKVIVEPQGIILSSFSDRRRLDVCVGVCTYVCVEI